MYYDLLCTGISLYLILYYFDLSLFSPGIIDLD